MRQKIGIVIFWIAVIWIFFWGIAASIYQSVNFLHVMTFDELNQSIWALDGSLMTIWGMAPPLGAIIAGIGILIYADVKGSTLWKFGIGIILGIILSIMVASLGHVSWLFAIGGTLILLFFLRILWLWAIERKGLSGPYAMASDFQLAGYIFFLTGMWYACGIAGPVWVKAFADQPPMLYPIIVMAFFVLGWFCLLMSHYKSRNQNLSK